MSTLIPEGSASGLFFLDFTPRLSRLLDRIEEMILFEGASYSAIPRSFGFSSFRGSFTRPEEGRCAWCIMWRKAAENDDFVLVIGRLCGLVRGSDRETEQE